MNGWSIVLHGGARTLPREDAGPAREGARAALAIGADLLAAGASALEAVEMTTRALEDNRVFNAGTGAVHNSAGEIELDAAIMDGASLNIGAVAALKNYPNPIIVARALLTEETILLCGDGAAKFAAAQGLNPSPLVLASPSNAASKDTVGCIALDMHGDLAVAVSTGGLSGKRPGRIGDSPLPGCGYYADNAVGAACLSGDGERIARTLLAGEVISALRTGFDPQHAAETAMARLERAGGEAGIIAMRPDGLIGCAHNSPHFTVAMQRQGVAPAVIVTRQECAVLPYGQ